MKSPSLQNNDDNFLDAQEEMYEATEERLDRLLWMILDNDTTDLTKLIDIMKRNSISTTP